MAVLTPSVLRHNPAVSGGPEGANALVVEVSSDLLGAAARALRTEGINSFYTAEMSLGGLILIVQEGMTPGTIVKARDVINQVWQRHHDARMRTDGKT